MDIPTLFSHLGLILPLLLAIGVALSFGFRRNPLVFFVWLPSVGAFGYSLFQVSRKLLAISRLHGPDAGFAGLEGLFLFPILAICIGGLIACFFARPRKEARRAWAVIPAVILYTAIATLSDRQNGMTFELILTDSEGGALSSVGAQVNVPEGGLNVGRQHLASDPEGRIQFRLKRNQSVGVQVMPSPATPQTIYSSPTYWTLSIGELQGSPGQFEIRHSWQRPVGGVVLNEGFREMVPSAKSIRIPLVLAPHESLTPGPLREKIRDAILAMRGAKQADDNYAYTCRNVESIEFIPLLIETYRQNENQRTSVIRGLAQIAGVLQEMNAGCKAVVGKARSATTRPSEHLTFQVNQLRAWAAVPADEVDNLRVLALVQKKIDVDAQQIISFVLEQVGSTPETITIIEELRGLGHSALKDLVSVMAANPPTEMHTVYKWSHPLWAIGARFEDLEPLSASGNPFLVILAVEATPNETLEGEIASKMLERLERARKQVSDPEAASRADMYIKMLRARLGGANQNA